LTNFGGANGLWDDPFFGSRSVAKNYLRSNKTILPKVSLNYPVIIPSFYAFYRFAEKQKTQPFPQRYCLLATWILMPFFFFEFLRPRILTRENRIFLAALVLTVLGQALMGFLCLATARYVLPMAAVSYLTTTAGLAILFRRIQMAVRKDRVP
jgi:hypothetical protein